MRHMLIVLVIILGAILVGAALYFYGPEEVREVHTEPSMPSTVQTVSFQVIAEGDMAAGVTERKNYAVYTEEDFRELWRMAYGENAPTLPRIDFTQNYVVGVFAGEKMSGGHTIAVSSVADSALERTISIALTRPGAGCVATQALTRPFQLVVLPLSDLTLSREESETEVACQ